MNNRPNTLKIDLFVKESVIAVNIEKRITMPLIFLAAGTSFKRKNIRIFIGFNNNLSIQDQAV